MARRYNDLLEGISGLVTPKVDTNSTSVWAQYTLRVPAEKRDALMAGLKEAGIPSVVYYPKPLHQQTAYRYFPVAGSLNASEELSGEVMSLPMHPYLEDSDQVRIAETVRNLLNG